MLKIIDTHDLKRTARECGSYFFEPETMRYFSSRLLDVEPTSADTLSGLFLTSERDRFSDLPREYNVRAYTVTHHAHEDGTRCPAFTAEKVATFSTLARARTALRKRAEEARKS